MVPMDNDKPTVIALREIAEGLVTSAILDDPVEEVAEFSDVLDDIESEVVAEVSNADVDAVITTDPAAPQT